MRKFIEDFDVTDIMFNQFVEMFNAFVDEVPDNRHRFHFDVRRFSRRVARYLYDYQVVRQWNNVLRVTAGMLEYTKSGMDKLLKAKK